MWSPQPQQPPPLPQGSSRNQPHQHLLGLAAAGTPQWSPSWLSGVLQSPKSRALPQLKDCLGHVCSFQQALLSLSEYETGSFMYHSKWHLIHAISNNTNPLSWSHLPRPREDLTFLSPSPSKLYPTNTPSWFVSSLPQGPPMQGRNSPVTPQTLHFISLMWSQQFYSPDNSLLLHNSSILLSAANFNFSMCKLLCCVPTLVHATEERTFVIPSPLFQELCVYSPFIQCSSWLPICLWVHHLDLISWRNICPQCSQISFSDTGTPEVHIQKVSASS